MFQVIAYVLPVIFSLLLITENRILAGFLKGVFGLADEIGFYDRQARHWWLVALFRWPFLLGVIGLIVPIPPIWWDFLLMLAAGLMFEWRHYKNRKAESEKFKQLPDPIDTFYQSDH